MSGGEDMSPPMDAERTPVRISVTAAVVIAVLGALLTGAIAVGVYKTRIEQLEKSDSAQDTLVVAHDRQLVELRTTNAEILRRLDSIDRKLETPR